MNYADNNSPTVFDYKQVVSVMELRELLLLEDSKFIPPLSTCVNINAWSDKLVENARFACCYCNNKIIGVVAIYCNNQETRRAHIPLVVVKNDYTNKGIATNLINKALICAKECNMQNVTIETQSDKALRLYQKLKFVIVEKKQIDDRMYYLLEQPLR